MSEETADAPLAERREPGAVWPTEVQMWLLRATLCDDAQALDAWAEWRSRIDPDDYFDSGSMRLFPLLYERARALGIEDPYLQRLKGIYRKAWAENQRLFHETKQALASLREVGIDTMILKGAPLVQDYYGSYGARPMGDLDIAVPLSQAEVAAQTLQAAGWLPNRGITPRTLRFRHSVGFNRADGRSVDLHWHICFESCPADFDRAFWDASIETQFQGIPTRALCAEDLFLHVVIHGIKWNPEPPIRWVADAATILRTAPNFDWERVHVQAAKLHVTLRLLKGVTYLREKMGVPIPDTFFERSERQPISRMERAETRVRLRDRNKLTHNPFAIIEPVLVDWWRLSYGRGLLPTLLGMPEYLLFRSRLRGLAIDLWRRLTRGPKRVTSRVLS